ncbi:MAG: hypothetical protein H7338_03880 [Candidatus Sericytochromatia bacterium]|nr:hypothetical protein [Candidatus Sericytochromatia bacterium]
MATVVVAAQTPRVVAAQTPSVGAGGRDVLVVYAQADQVTLRGQNVMTALETVCNHLGLTVRYHDLAGGLPSEAVSRSARAVISVLDGDAAPGAAAYAGWLAACEGRHQPVVLLGGLGFLHDAQTGLATEPSLVDAVLKPLGVRYDGTTVQDPARLRLATPHPALTFERPWSAPLPPYVRMTSTDPANEVFLQLQRTDTGDVSDQGVISRGGAVLLGRESLLYTNPFSFRQRWRLDPFWLLSRALGLAGEPRLDPTTLNGRRVFYAHIDGDGFANRANLPGRPLAAESVRDSLLRRTPLPTTVSVIANEMVGAPALQAVAKSIFALPNVEPASHSYSHPHDWETGTVTPNGHVGEGADSDVKRAQVTLSPQHEIDDSLRVIQALLPAGKRVALMLWSGRTNPTEPFLARTAALDLPNLNGGDAVVDERFPSYANLAPFGRRVGPYVQPYASMANENLFTNRWTGPFDGQAKAIDTFRFAGAPRRLAPVNIYYHFYAGERMAGVKALQTLYRWAESQPLNPVVTSHYARMVQGFFAAEVVADGPAAWRISGHGECRSVRFDDEPRLPELAASQGIAGWCREARTLYVHLAPGPVRLVLAAATAPVPHLESANGILQAWSMDTHQVTAGFGATVPLQVIMAGLAPGQPVAVTGITGPKSADADGRLRLSGPVGDTRLAVRW